MNVANSTMKKKNSVPIVDFCESSWTCQTPPFYFNCCEVDNACLSQVCAPLAQYWYLSCLK